MHAHNDTDTDPQLFEIYYVTDTDLPSGGSLSVKIYRFVIFSN